MITFKTGRSVKWVKITATDGSDFEIQVTGPSFGDLVDDYEVPLGFVRARIDATVTDWRGVQSADTPPVAIGFSKTGLQQLCESDPAILLQVANAASAAFNPPQKRPNSDASAATSTEAPNGSTNAPQPPSISSDAG